MHLVGLLSSHWLTLQAPCGNFSGTAALREACRTVFSVIAKELPSAATGPTTSVYCLLPLMNFCIWRDEQVGSCNGWKGWLGDIWHQLSETYVLTTTVGGCDRKHEGRWQMKEKLNFVTVVWPLYAVDTVCFLLSLLAYKRLGWTCERPKIGSGPDANDFHLIK